MKKLKWGILSTAKIGVDKVIPAMLKSEKFEVAAICSREISKAKHWAEALSIPKYYGSYEELINDPDIDIIYNPLPNHMHVEWTAKSIKAGKHVLCEKPFFMNQKEAQHIQHLKNKYNVKVAEAFMVANHPQWIKAKAIIKSGTLGEVKLYNAFFSYYNLDPQNIRNIADYGGGALWDIGCYPVMTSKFLFDENPVSVFCSSTIDPVFQTDTLSTAQLKFNSGKSANFTVSTQLAPYQRVHVIGTKAEMEILIPFNAPNDRPVCIKLNHSDILHERIEKIELPVCDQYRLQAEYFVEAIDNDKPEMISVEDAVAHCKIIEALKYSSLKNEWVKIV